MDCFSADVFKQKARYKWWVGCVGDSNSQQITLRQKRVFRDWLIEIFGHKYFILTCLFSQYIIFFEIRPLLGINVTLI